MGKNHQKFPVPFRNFSDFECFNTPLHSLDVSCQIDEVKQGHEIEKTFTKGKKQQIFFVENRYRQSYIPLVLKSGYHEYFDSKNVEWFVGGFLKLGSNIIYHFNWDEPGKSI